MRHREPARPAAQALEDLDARPQRRTQVLEPLGDVHLMQVVRPHPHRQALLHQVLDRGDARVQPPHQHRLVFDRHTRVDQPLAGLARLGGDLLGMVEMGHDEQRRKSSQRARQLVIDSHRQTHRNPRADADDLHVLQRAQGLEQLDEPRGRKQQRIAARDEHVANLGVLAQVGDRFRQLFAGDAALVAAGDPPARAVAAVDRAVVERQKQHAIRVLVHQRAHRTVAVLAERIAQLAGADRGLRAHRNRLHPHRAPRRRGVDQRQVVRRNPEPKRAFGLLAAAPFVLRQRHEPFELVERSHAVAQLPAPVTPFGVGGLRKEFCPSGHEGAQDASRALRRQGT